MKIKTPQRFWRVRKLAFIRHGIKSAKADTANIIMGAGFPALVNATAEMHAWNHDDALLWLRAYDRVSEATWAKLTQDLVNQTVTAPKGFELSK